MLLTAGPDSYPNAPCKGLRSLRPSQRTSKTFSVSEPLGPVKAAGGCYTSAPKVPHQQVIGIS